MKGAIRAVALTAVLLLAGCGPKSQQEVDVDQAGIKPFKIAEVDGVTLWKVHDRTGGGPEWVYFTSRGDTYEQHSCGKNCTKRTFVPGAP